MSQQQRQISSNKGGGVLVAYVENYIQYYEVDTTSYLSSIL